MYKNTKHLKEVLNTAESNARKRDNATNIDLNVVAKEAEKASELDVGIYIKERKNKAEFGMVIKENLWTLIEVKYLTNAELALVLSLLPLVEMHSNAITDNEGQFLTVSEIARLLKRDLSGTSKLINKLVWKGIIYEFVDSNEIREFKRPVSNRPFFFNPEIVFCGDRNKVNATLSRLVINSDQLEKKKIHLDWKLWIHPNVDYGTLYRRITYLKYKKGK